MARVGTASVAPDTDHLPMHHGRAHRMRPERNRPWRRGGVIQGVEVPADRRSQDTNVPGSDADLHPRWL
jgi:hypothetical protein